MDDKVLLLIESEENFATEDAPSLHEMIVGRRRNLFRLMFISRRRNSRRSSDGPNDTDKDQTQ
jgi:hypothetical protein